MKRKQERFKIIEQYQNVIEPSKSLYKEISGKWRQTFFKNENPLTLADLEQEIEWLRDRGFSLELANPQRG